MLCSSFTKTIAPGLRIGWIAPGRYYDKLLQMKYAASGTNVPQRSWRPQLYSRRPLSPPRAADAADLPAQYGDLHLLAARVFPCGICVTRPLGGFMLWVELPEQVDMVCVAKQLCRLKIQVAPGSLFSASGKYRNCLRINCALPPTDKHKEVMVQLGMALKVAME
jgi:DNA-binding transcriptional MocR family regulator